MSIRSQDLDTNALLLYPLAKGASSPNATPVYSLPQDDEDSDGGQGSALRDGEEEGTDLKLALQADAKAKLSNESVETDVKESSGTSAAPIDPTVLPAGYGAAIIASFLAMIKYLNEMAEQGYQVTVYSANAMIGTDGKKGLIQSWVDAGMASAQAQGEQMKDEAIGSLVSGAACGLSLLGSVGGFVKNSVAMTSEVGGGMFQNENGRISMQLENAQSYKKMLNGTTDAETIGQSESETVGDNQAAANANQQAVENTQAEQQQQTTRTELDKKTTELKEKLTQSADERYKAKRDGQELSQADQDTNAAIKLAADQLVTTERKEALEKADKWIERLQNQLGQRENAQQAWVNVLGQFSNAGQAGGNAYGGFTKQQQAVEAQKQKANSDTLAQTSQTTEGVKEKANQKAQADQEQMGQMAQAMAQALASQTQSRA